MSVLSDMADGAGFFYGFLPGDHRQLNVRLEVRPGRYCWIAYVGGVEVGDGFDTKAEAEAAAVAYARGNAEK